jgi:hypothetical protein
VDIIYPAFESIRQDPEPKGELEEAIKRLPKLTLESIPEWKPLMVRWTLEVFCNAVYDSSTWIHKLALDRAKTLFQKDYGVPWSEDVDQKKYLARALGEKIRDWLKRHLD